MKQKKIRATIDKRKRVSAAIIQGFRRFEIGTAAGMFPRQLPHDKATCIELELDRAGFAIVRKRS